MNIPREFPRESASTAKARCMLSDGAALAPSERLVTSTSPLSGRAGLGHEGPSSTKDELRLVRSAAAVCKADPPTDKVICKQPSGCFNASFSNESFSLKNRNNSAVSAGRALLGLAPTASTARSTPMHRIASSNSTRSILREGKYSSLTSLKSSNSRSMHSTKTSTPKALSGEDRKGSQRSVIFASVISQDAEDDQKYKDDEELDLDELLLQGNDNNACNNTNQSDGQKKKGSEWSEWNDSRELDILNDRQDDTNADDLSHQLQNLSAFSAFGEKSMGNMSELSLDDMSLDGIMSQ